MSSIEINSCSARSVAILAGNSRVSCDESGRISVEAQLSAFKAAVARASELAEQGTPVFLSVALDHMGVFRKQFLRPGLSNSAKRNPNLSQVREEISSVFALALEASPFRLERILVIHEDSARAHASHVVQSGACPPNLVRVMRVDDPDDDRIGASCGTQGGSCSYGPRDTDRVTCAAVTAEYFAKAISMGNVECLEVFFENSPWSQVPVFIRGAVLLGALGNLTAVELNLVLGNGRVFGERRGREDRMSHGLVA